jgi:hypothetical protein
MTDTIEKEKLSHIENIDKSMRWLKENALWEDFREIVMDGVMELANKLRKERLVDLDPINFINLQDESGGDE